MVVTDTKILRAMRHKFIHGYTDVVFKSMKEDVMKCFSVYGGPADEDRRSLREGYRSIF